MAMICENCGKPVSASTGKYVYYQGRMMYACEPCAITINDEIKCATTVCSIMNRKKSKAESIICHTDAFDAFLKSIDSVLGKIPDIGNLLSDIPFLVSLVKSYVAGEYTDIPHHMMIAVVAALLYVISPIDMIPDAMPSVGYEDDAMVVAFCKKLFHEDLDKYRIWHENVNREPASESDVDTTESSTTRL